jgi:tRNA uridine 5-carboxymethylaminomethyl modification enzyme
MAGEVSNVPRETLSIFTPYDVIVVGGGHAGCEAAAASAKLGARTLLISLDLQALARLSCNPSIGGIAKGQIVREIDALGGLTGIIADKSMIQFRMLNRSKGPAMWSPRSQNDRMLYSIYWRKEIEKIDNLFLWRDEVKEIIVENDKVVGVRTGLNLEFKTKAVVITAGTFLNGRIFIGKTILKGGRIGERNAEGLTENLRKYGIESAKLKTGTPVRIDGRSVNFSKLAIQPGDENPGKFSFSDRTKPLKRQLPCYIAYTNEAVHEELRKGFAYSPLFSGVIEGVGVRYCPSIEDKLVKFADKDHHQLFLEPEGWNTYEYYLNGFSSSLPLENQYNALRLIPGFEHAIIIQPGYAIEYDFFPPTQLYPSLMSKKIENLFFAGQVNGTTGYEEAAAQGLMAGINAARSIAGADPLVLRRDQAYIGVLIDDLVTKGTNEPYRMFTSRAEHRLVLRQDNADIRLTPIGYEIGLVERSQYEKVLEKIKKIETYKELVKKISVEPEQINSYLEEKKSTPLTQKVKWVSVLLRPEVSLQDSNVKKLLNLEPDDYPYLETLEIEIKYENYIQKQYELIERIKQFENIKFPPNFDFFKVTNISYEAREKLSKIKPQTLAQASRISGISPADIAVLLSYLKTVYGYKEK